MKRLTITTLAIACALGMGAAAGQSVQRDGAVVGKAAKPAHIQLAQASSSAGGAASGAAAGGAATGVGLGAALVLVGAAVATIAVTVDSGSAVSH